MAPRMLHWSSLAVLVAGLLSLGPLGARAQDTSVTCLSSFDWMNNGKGQNPCLVAAYLQAVCTGDGFTIPPLPPGFSYTGPTAAEANLCQCSSVTYSLMSACGLCQNHTTVISWPSWNLNCTTFSEINFPPVIPVGTAVPFWAFQTIPANGSFDAVLAQSLGDSPEATAIPTQSTTSLVPTTATSLPISSPTSSSILPNGSSSKSNVGAIAGGVIGGVVGVALIAAVVVFFVRKKRRSQIPPSAQFAGHPPPANSSSGYVSHSVPPVSPYSPQMTQPKHYDPSDPSTFPVTLGPPTMMIDSTTNVPASFVTYSSNYPSLRPGTGGAYTGAPEI